MQVLNNISPPLNNYITLLSKLYKKLSLTAVDEIKKTFTVELNRKLTEEEKKDVSKVLTVKADKEAKVNLVEVDAEDAKKVNYKLENLPKAGAEDVIITITAKAGETEEKTQTYTVKAFVPTLTNITAAPVKVEKNKENVKDTLVANLAVVGEPSEGIEFKLAEDNTEDTFTINAEGNLVIAEGKTVTSREYTVKITATEIDNPLNTVTKDVKFTAEIGE